MSYFVLFPFALRFLGTYQVAASVVDVGKVRGGVVLRKGFALLIVEPDKGIAVRCGSGLCGQLFAPGQQGIDVRAGIGHFVEFHRETFLSGRKLHI